MRNICEGTDKFRCARGAKPIQHRISNMRIRPIALALLLGLFHSQAAPLEPFPLAATVAAMKTNLASANVESTRLKRSDYLATISGVVHYFHHFQAEDGSILDPFLHKEFQYSTPCYAWAATALVVGAGETNLLDSAALALECALTELAENRPAMRHGDFFTFPVMFAYENLRGKVPSERRKKWDSLLRQIDPTKCYSDILHGKHEAVHNWNVVAISGEFLRHQDGFTDMRFVEDYLKAQLPNFTTTGQYRDPNVPMAYDHFPRHFLAAMLERGYKGEHVGVLNELLERAAWTSVLIQSPCGELPTGGRSAQHQWNEAEQCVSYEIWANRKQREGDKLAAQAFKRAAHLGLQSIKRWVRPSGELWIVKNRFDPAARHGFQGYSSHSQYNLLAASMMATAWNFADDAIAEGPCPADVGGYAIALPQFHKIFANAGGMYLEIETGADPEYNSTGLIRVHKSGVEPLIGPSDSAPIVGEPLALGIAWKRGNDWKSLAQFGRDKVHGATLAVSLATPEEVKFSVTYKIAQSNLSEIVESYDVTRNEIKVGTEAKGNVTSVSVRFPALVFDGERATDIAIDGATGSVTLDQSRQTFTVKNDCAQWQRSGRLISFRNGFVEAIEAEVPGRQIEYSLKPLRLVSPIAQHQSKAR